MFLFHRGSFAFLVESDGKIESKEILFLKFTALICLLLFSLLSELFSNSNFTCKKYSFTASIPKWLCKSNFWWIPTASVVIAGLVIPALNQTSLRGISMGFYRLLGVEPIYPTFADVRSALIGIDCNEVSGVGDDISCGNRGNAYLWPSSVFLMLRGLYKFESFTEEIGLVILFFFVLCTWLVTQISSRTFNLLFTLVLFTYPFQIGIERLNLDILVFSSYFLIYYLNVKHGYSFKVISISVFLLAFVSLIKYYPILTFIGYLLVVALSRKPLKRFGFSFLALLATLVILLPDLAKILAAPGNQFRGSFGISVFSESLALNANSLKGIVSLMLLYILFFALLYSFLRKILVRKYFLLNPLSGEQRLALILFISSFVSTWLTSMNYPYKLIFLVNFLMVLLQSSNSENSIFVLKFSLIFATVIPFFITRETFWISQNTIIALVCMVSLVSLVSEFSRYKKHKI